MVERILNKNWDFSYVIRGTIQFWLHEKTAIKEYVPVGNHLLENQVKKYYLLLIFTFVRGDGVRKLDFYAEVACFCAERVALMGHRKLPIVFCP